MIRQLIGAVALGCTTAACIVHGSYSRYHDLADAPEGTVDDLQQVEAAYLKVARDKAAFSSGCAASTAESQVVARVASNVAARDSRGRWATVKGYKRVATIGVSICETKQLFAVMCGSTYAALADYVQEKCQVLLENSSARDRAAKQDEEALEEQRRAEEASQQQLMQLQQQQIQQQQLQQQQQQQQQQFNQRFRSY